MNDQTSTNPEAEQFLTFRLGSDEFGVEIKRVEGIQGWDKVTQVPQTPKHVLGVIDLRGSVVPIIDLRTRLGFPDGSFTSTTVVIVVRVEVESQNRTFGLVVDAVSEVRDVMPEQRKARPQFGGGVKTQYMLGLATVEEHMIILLNLDELMNDEDFDEEPALSAQDGPADASDAGQQQDSQERSVSSDDKAGSAAIDAESAVA